MPLGTSPKLGWVTGAVYVVFVWLRDPFAGFMGCCSGLLVCLQIGCYDPVSCKLRDSKMPQQKEASLSCHRNCL